MFEPDHDRKLTRKERLAVILALAASVAAHLLLLAGGGGFQAWSTKEKKRERLMVIRQVREVAPPADLAPAPVTRQVQARIEPAPEPAPKGTTGIAPTQPKAQRKEREQPAGDAPREPELSEKMEEEAREAEEQEEEPEPATPQAKPPGGEHGENSVSVVTDLAAASFAVAGPQEYEGAGTFWLRKGAPPGAYTVTFRPVAGFVTPAAQKKELVAKGQIVFVGKYKRSTEVVVDADPAAQFTIYRPDGRPLDMRTPGRALFDDLPPGNYTAVFKPIPGHQTPGPVTSTLGAGGRLSFRGEYKHIADAPPPPPPPPAARTASAGDRAGTYQGGAPQPPVAPARKKGPGDAPPPAGAATGSQLDRRVQVIVKSYPETDIEEYHDPIPYPERVIQRSNFQSGWCQVYLVIRVSDRGEIERITVERPGPGERAQFEELIQAVERAVRGWDYDKVAAEVNVDARFYVE